MGVLLSVYEGSEHEVVSVFSSDLQKTFITVKISQFTLHLLGLISVSTVLGYSHAEPCHEQSALIM